MTDIIQMTALVVQASMMLRDARIARSYQLKSLLQPADAPRKPLDPSTKEWLIEKTSREIADIDEFLCSVNKICFNESACNPEEIKETTQQLDERSRIALEYLMSRPEILDKIVSLATRQQQS